MAQRMDDWAKAAAGLMRRMPLPRWLAEYRAEWLRRDIVAGVTLAAYAIPVSLAYATLPDCRRR